MTLFPCCPDRQWRNHIFARCGLPVSDPISQIVSTINIQLTQGACPDSLDCFTDCRNKTFRNWEILDLLSGNLEPALLQSHIEVVVVMLVILMFLVMMVMVAVVVVVK